MKNLIIVLLFILTIIPILPAENDILQKDDFAVVIQGRINDQIGFEDSFSKMYALLGEPNQILISKNQSGSEWDEIIHKYQGLMISGYRELKKIYYILVTDEGYSTKRGISIGDTKQRVLEVYGKPDYKGPYYIYDLIIDKRGGAWVLTFKFADNKVSTIIMNLSD